MCVYDIRVSLVYLNVSDSMKTIPLKYVTVGSELYSFSFYLIVICYVIKVEFSQ